MSVAKGRGAGLCFAPGRPGLAKVFSDWVRIILPFTQIGREWCNVPSICQALGKSVDAEITPGGRGLTQASDGLEGQHSHIRKKTVDVGSLSTRGRNCRWEM